MEQRPGAVTRGSGVGRGDGSGGAERGAALAVHPGALGDVLLAVPALRALRSPAPGRSPAGRPPGGGAVVLAAQPHIAGLLAALGVVDRGVPFDALGLDRLFVDDGGEPDGRLRRAARVVCWFGSRDPVFVRRLRAIAPGAVVAPSADPARLVWEHLVDTVAPVSPLAGPDRAGASAAPVADRAGRTRPDRAARRGVRVSAAPDREAPDPGGCGEARAGAGGARGLCRPIAVPAAVGAEGRRLLETAGWDGRAPLLVLHPGAGGAGKRWPAEGFARVVEAAARQRPGLAVAVHEGPADAGVVAALVPHLARSPLVLRAPALAALAGALGHAAAYLGNDSGISHLAAAVGAPAVILFGESNRPWRPWSPAARTLVVDMPALRRGDVDAAGAALAAAWRG